MKTNRLGLIAVLAFVSAFSMPRSLYAQPTAYGTWDGELDVQITQVINGQTTVLENSSGDGTLLIDYFAPYTLYISMGGIYAYGSNPIPGAVDFGPTSASGSLYTYGPTGLVVANFFATYQSILPDGMIDTTGGFASADISYSQAVPTGGTDFFFFSFSGAGAVPEPSSLVTASIALLAIGVFTWIRGARRPARGAMRVAS